MSGVREPSSVKELIRTNNVVTISFVGSLLKDAGIGHFIADENMSVMDGSIGILPRRILVEDDRFEEARKLVMDADLGEELRPSK